MIKKIGFVQPNFQQGPKELNSFYLPYSAGVLLSYIFNDDFIKQNYEIGTIVWRRDPIELVAQDLATHYVVGFSTYVWNHRYNYELAARIKQINPDVICIFGGPEVAITDPDLFVKEPFMDVVIKGEGEEILKNLLITPRKNWRDVAGLLINENNSVPIDTGPASRIENLEALHSPYLTGIFDNIIRQNPTISWGATIETNRGCPFACTFCDWGSLTYNKVKKFDLERVFAELEWIGQHCEYITFTDANFGMFAERDNLILDKFLETQEKYPNLKQFNISWTKNQKNEVVQMVKKLMQGPGFGTGLTVSVQSMDDNVLDNIKRRNMELNKITDIFELCNKENIPVYTELILGLPGETAESWQENFWKIFRAGNHSGINILQAQMLENAEMNLLQRRLYKIESLPIFDYISDSYDHEECEESIDIVVSTKDIDRKSMLDIMTWNAFIQAFHAGGISSFLSRFLEKYHQIDYKIFYSKLQDSIPAGSWLEQELQNTRNYFQNWIENGRANHPSIGKIKVPGWMLLYRIIILIHYHNKVDDILCWLKEFVSNHFEIPDMILEELIRFQRRYIMTYQDISQYPISDEFDYDFLGYILDDSELKRFTTYKFYTREDTTMSNQRFLENLFFGRKRLFGKSIIEKVDKN